ncbi:LysR family transcriptional regulator [Methyloraptor flagellatus]|uniref:LysR family transcriptional regulator n=1 Tax=Methyloraptor flagellatus TaxID=3162530 RepID=A0AAU7XGG2_9HYPH
MDDQRVAYLYEAIRTGSIRAAAERMRVNASTISRQIALIEKDFGTPMIERLARGIRPTEAGRLLADWWAQQQTAFADVEQKIRELRASRRGTVRLVLGEGFVGDLLSGPLQDFVRQNPGIAMSVEVMPTTDIVRTIVEDEAQIGLVFNPPFDERLHTTARIASSIRLLVPRGHPLASAPRHPVLADLAAERIGVLLPGFGVQRMIDAALRRANVSIEPVMRTNSFAVLRGLVASDLGVVLVPAFVAVPELTDGSIIAVPIDDPMLDAAEIHIVTRRGRQLPAAATKFLSHLRARLRAFGAPLAAVDRA